MTTSPQTPPTGVSGRDARPETPDQPQTPERGEREGQFVVVPRGLWHRHRNVRDLIEVYLTPGTTLQSAAADPRRT
jgi:hypothetical protein